MTENYAKGKIYPSDSAGLKLYGANISDTDPELVGISTRVDGDLRRVYITPEDFVRMVQDTQIPGVKISYTPPPKPLPTEDGLYAPASRVELNELAGARILRLENGQWKEGNGTLSGDRVRQLQDLWGGLVRLVPEVQQ